MFTYTHVINNAGDRMVAVKDDMGDLLCMIDRRSSKLYPVQNISGVDLRRIWRHIKECTIAN